MDNSPIHFNTRVFDFWSNTIKIYPQGIDKRKRGGKVCSSALSKGSTRGKITRFSSHSALRLRRALLSSSVDNSVNLGITLTLPWVFDSSLPDSLLSDYRLAFDRFSKLFRRRFPNSAAIFRHELQRRGCPHCHLVVWLSRLDFNYVSFGRSSTSSSFAALIWSFWFRSLEGFNYSMKSLSGFVHHGVKIDLLSDSLSAYRYICDHSSKKKLCQLGYQGKQWGFLNRRVIVSLSPVIVEFSRPDHFILLNRHLCKVSRFFVGSGLSRHLSKSSSGRSVVFVRSKTVESCILAIREGRICSISDLDFLFGSKIF